jgi:hypothetical protein
VSHRIRAVLSSVERRGAWTVPARLEVRAFWGNAVLDLREAVFEAAETTIDIGVTMANVEIVVPRNTVDSQLNRSANAAARSRARTAVTARRTTREARRHGAPRQLRVMTLARGIARGAEGARRHRDARAAAAAVGPPCRAR